MASADRVGLRNSAQSQLGEHPEPLEEMAQSLQTELLSFEENKKKKDHNTCDISEDDDYDDDDTWDEFDNDDNNAEQDVTVDNLPQSEPHTSDQQARKDRDNPATCSILVTNFNPVLTKEALEFVFENKGKSGGGPVTAVRKIHKNSAVITYEEHTDASSVIRKGGFEHKGFRIDVEWAKEETTLDNPATCSILVTNFNPVLTEEALEFVFENKDKTGGGPVTSVKKIEKNSAVITFDEHTDACSVIEKGGFEHKGFRIDVEWANEETTLDNPRTCSILVTNFNPVLTDEALECVFENKDKTGGGPVSAVKKIQNNSAIITFEEYADARSVIEKDGFKHKGFKIDVEWAKEETISVVNPTLDAIELEQQEIQLKNTEKRQFQQWLLDNSEKNEEGTPKIRKLKTKRGYFDGRMKLRKFSFGDNNDSVDNKIIMVVGATGAGKSTLINGMVNYVFGVEWNDPYRFKLITEDTTSHNQAVSQTVHITAYTIFHRKDFAVPYSLTIIDTPGFGDTSGIERDEIITRQIKEFFSMTNGEAIAYIDSICFVTQSSAARLTPTQHYVFDQVLALFGRDISDNIQMMLTFCDAQKPQALEAIRAAEIPYKDSYKFNNSAIFAQQESGDEALSDFDAMFWKLGMQSFKHFMMSIITMSRKSLLLTKDVLHTRDQIQTTIYDLQSSINMGLEKLNSREKLTTEIEKYKAEIKGSSNFEVEEQVEKMIRQEVPGGQFTTICSNCHHTCHEICAYANDSDKAKCCAMDRNGKCTICPQNCKWQKHSNLGYIYVLKIETKKTTLHELYSRYNVATQGEKKVSVLLDEISKEYLDIQDTVVMLTDKVKECAEKLNEIALKPNPLSTAAYLKVLIQREESNKTNGFEKRLEQLRSGNY